MVVAPQGREQLFMGILICLIILSGIISLINLEANGTITMKNFGGMNGNALPGMINIVPPSTNTGATTIAQNDFTSSATYNVSSILPMAPYGIVLYNPWTQTNSVGYVLTGALPGTEGQFLERAVQSNGGIYDVVYNINNSVNGQFAIDVEGNLAAGYLKILFTNYDCEVWAPNNQLTPLQVLFANSYGYPQVVTKVETILNPSTNTLTINIADGTTTGSTWMVDLSSVVFPAGAGAFYYAGVEAWTNGFTVQQIVAPIQTSVATQANSGTYTGIPIVDNIIQAGANVVNALSQIGTLIGVMFGLGSSPFFPPWEVAIVYGSCIGTLIFMVVEIGRGD